MFQARNDVMYYKAKPLPSVSIEPTMLICRRNALVVLGTARWKQIGEGRFGTVWKQCACGDEPAMAIKSVGDPESGAQMYREIVISMRLGIHSNVLSPLFVAFSDIGTPFIAMPLCCNSLDKLQVKMSQSAVMRCLYQINAAIDHLHQRGIAHYDIKPANVLYLDTMNVECTAARFVLADFGIATDTNLPKVRRTDGMCATVLQPPEVITLFDTSIGNSEYTCRLKDGIAIDFWQLGCLGIVLLGSQQVLPWNDESVALEGLQQTPGAHDMSAVRAAKSALLRKILFTLYDNKLILSFATFLRTRRWQMHMRIFQDAVAGTAAPEHRLRNYPPFVIAMLRPIPYHRYALPHQQFRHPVRHIMPPSYQARLLLPDPKCSDQHSQNCVRCTQDCLYISTSSLRLLLIEYTLRMFFVSELTNTMLVRYIHMAEMYALLSVRWELCRCRANNRLDTAENVPKNCECCTFRAAVREVAVFAISWSLALSTYASDGFLYSTIEQLWQRAWSCVDNATETVWPSCANCPCGMRVQHHKTSRDLAKKMLWPTIAQLLCDLDCLRTFTIPSLSAENLISSNMAHGSLDSARPGGCFQSMAIAVLACGLAIDATYSDINEITMSKWTSFCCLVATSSDEILPTNQLWTRVIDSLALCLRDFQPANCLAEAMHRLDWKC